jgi:hypothetical protein
VERCSFVFFKKNKFVLNAQGPLPPRLGDAWRLHLPAVVSAPGAFVLAFYGGANPFHATVRVRLRLVVGSSNPGAPLEGSTCAVAEFGASDVVLDVGEVSIGHTTSAPKALS